MEDYEKLLDEAYSKVKKIDSKSGRFEIPKVDVQNVGNKTILSNFIHIVSYVRRTPEQVYKFLTKELASSGKIENDRLIFNRKISSSQVQDKFNLYVKKYVLCNQCGKPDTEIVKQDNLQFIHCLACGAKQSLGR
ncbi:translation initiation factor IF-2 subunit beta [Candidatus Pacearchaeota archaeon CG10_big_fil_rev_8_21_14_0_10_31_9]|nr:MAG: translation initiation factor IF-2 subunit beta [Candidatus Pacearchaeota archaeon CG1_02_32_21]PIN95047.1 MAG: translation initiation factor IF-2 subunit beta [Candidatus Pacearchaeota archaeon CG10_big_fil_rev_8_21_14_0_10_31_9]PIZ82462.1 MAG: translation initiation factor IF-2 subunit beta [Candidatus Pacearchaeota archaeon CG_4_10_14_0_2_um_filter_05_32_18]